jgi:hypothetical protein
MQMTFVIFWALFAVAVGIWASNRGRSGFGWFMLAVIISPLLAFIFCAVAKDLSKAAVQAAPSQASHVKCPACAEWVLPEASVCKHCGGPLTPQPGYAFEVAERTSKQENQNLLIGFGVVAFFVALVAVIVNMR